MPTGLHDFDFQIGEWRVHHRILRPGGKNEWLEMEGTCVMRPLARNSLNVEDHLAVPLARVVAAVAEHAPVREAEVIGLPPLAAFAGFPPDLPVRNRRTLEDALVSDAGHGR